MARLQHPLLARLRDMVVRQIEKDLRVDSRYFSVELLAIVEAAIAEAHRLGAEDLVPVQRVRRARDSERPTVRPGPKKPSK